MYHKHSNMAPQSENWDKVSVCTQEGRREPSVQRAALPVRRWLMHGAVMLGREFCYAMETALVTPVLLQIGLPEQYYSLTWFLSPVLGLIFTPLIGSASDRCRSRWGRRRPFILGLCVGILLGLALFLNGHSLYSLAIGDMPSDQPIGIILTVLGVVILDFSADGSEGPIRAYLLDVADAEEQDMALNIHTFSAGLGGAVGYMMGGLDWTQTGLGQVFQAQEQVLFFFASIIFITSVGLHMFSIPEQQYGGQKGTREDEVSSESSARGVPQLSITSAYCLDYRDIRLGQALDKAFVGVDIVRSKSDSALAEAKPTLNLELHSLIPMEVNPSIFQDKGSSSQGTMSRQHSSAKIHEDFCSSSLPLGEDPVLCSEEVLLNGQESKVKAPKREAAWSKSERAGHKAAGAVSSAHPRCTSYFRQPSFTFSYYGRRGGGLRRAGGKLSRSMNDIYDGQRHPQRQWAQHRASPASSEDEESEEGGEKTTVRLLWLSMLKMPPELRRLCVCHLLTWLSFTAQVVFYTDFMGQVVFEGDPSAAANSTARQNYHRGVQMGCWGLVVYAATAAVCSALLQKYLDSYDLSIRVVYIMGSLSFSVGTATMAIFPNVYVTMVMVSTMGIITMSISYSPYALLGQYHDLKEYIHHSPGNSKRGFGIDCAILSCQVYVAQILVASALGAVVDTVGTQNALLYYWRIALIDVWKRSVLQRNDA
ncbi:solute carrier family 45 member 4-like [Scleropages formosus]|uniref:Solute carrier family 45 member 4-like n=1 Tax=Scleropages formosus TaxID=113540 RepID=A0A0P7UQL4_SCLFO|nr:solute carrier family 45 member 4-like [Scleropages formosus]